ncbi:MAG TPA: hypothetical protein VG368_02345, partial [Acidimicrobiales bacterium]|nr:hypothetical protein [Acidimicrobiales bacterium]
MASAADLRPHELQAFQLVWKRLDSPLRGVVRADVERTERLDGACLEDKFYGLAEFNERFPDDQACFDHLWRERFS